MCGTPKPGTVDTNREGVGGGFKERDEAEIADARRRREQFDNDDAEMCVPQPRPSLHAVRAQGPCMHSRVGLSQEGAARLNMCRWSARAA